MLSPRARDRDLAAMNGHDADGKALLRLLDRNLLAEKIIPAELFQRLIGRFHMATTMSFFLTRQAVPSARAYAGSANMVHREILSSRVGF
ncbi:hypothetical protein [Sphingomonas sp. So64.6b]|uniref:hypothetical protein n=1 Tax=Sphingomonas sp. So64.6b TaxID=2997354 RepID=UPI001FCE9210|nr:hypothetical protein [Sphingomonas sp. So64.6b]